MPGLGLFPVYVNLRQELMLYFFVANMVNIIHRMQILNMFDSCTDTMGPFIVPLSHAPIRQWTRQLEVEYSHKDQKELFDNCQKLCPVIGTSVSLSSLNLSIRRL